MLACMLGVVLASISCSCASLALSFNKKKTQKKKNKPEEKNTRFVLLCVSTLHLSYLCVRQIKW